MPFESIERLALNTRHVECNVGQVRLLCLRAVLCVVNVTQTNVQVHREPEHTQAARADHQVVVLALATTVHPIERASLWAGKMMLRCRTWNTC
jgi:hypothetical protein